MIWMTKCRRRADRTSPAKKGYLVLCFSLFSLWALGQEYAYVLKDEVCVEKTELENKVKSLPDSIEDARNQLVYPKKALKKVNASLENYRLANVAREGKKSYEKEVARHLAAIRQLTHRIAYLENYIEEKEKVIAESKAALAVWDDQLKSDAKAFAELKGLKFLVYRSEIGICTDCEDLTHDFMKFRESL